MKRVAITIEGKNISLNIKYINQNFSYQQALEWLEKEIWNSALRLLKVRPRTKKEIREKLLEKQFLPEEVENVICLLEKKNLLNEEDFLRFFFEGYKNKPYGEYAIRQKLKEKGISEEKIKQAFQSYCQENDWIEEIINLIKKIEHKYNKYSDYEKKQRINRYLYGRGFSSSSIQQAWERLSSK